MPETWNMSKCMSVATVIAAVGSGGGLLLLWLAEHSIVTERCVTLLVALVCIAPS